MTEKIEHRLCSSLMRAAYRRGNECVSPISHVVGFWIFLAGAGCLFAASVFFPMWREQQDALAASKAIQTRLDGLRTELTDLRTVAKALDEDPIINERAALRELNFYVPGQQIVATSPGPIEQSEAEPATAATTLAPRGRWTAMLPPSWLSLDAWSDWVCQSDVRRGMLLGAAFLMSAAFILFAPPAPRSLRHAIVKQTEPARSW